MKHQEIFDKAYHSLIDFYAGKPDIGASTVFTAKR